MLSGEVRGKVRRLCNVRCALCIFEEEHVDAKPTSVVRCHQFVEHFRAVRQLLIVGTVLVQQSYGLAVAPLGVGKLVALPVDVAQGQQQHTLLDAVACGLFVALLVGLDGVDGAWSCRRP